MASTNNTDWNTGADWGNKYASGAPDAYPGAAYELYTDCGQGLICVKDLSGRFWTTKPNYYNRLYIRGYSGPAGETVFKE